jgi:hypothetical protein
LEPPSLSSEVAWNRRPPSILRVAERGTAERNVSQHTEMATGSSFRGDLRPQNPLPRDLAVSAAVKWRTTTVTYNSFTARLYVIDTHARLDGPEKLQLSRRKRRVVVRNDASTMREAPGGRGKGALCSMQVE